jgi:signal transduction histidine kinase
VRWPPLPARLFWRVYLNGLLLLALVAFAVAGVVHLFAREPGGRTTYRFAAYSAARLAELRRDPAGLAAEVRRLHDAFGVSVTVYGRSGPLAWGGDAPLEPLDPADRARLPAGVLRVGGHGFRFAAPLDGEPGGYVLLAGEPIPPDPLRGASVLGAVLLALAVASIPLARAIAAPLERLRAAVRAFGDGDLSARARLATRGEVGEVAAAFDVMADRLQAMLRSEKELLANVSHELRTPLARIRVALEMAAEGDLERARRYLGEIGADLDELSRLVDDVLTAARLDLAADRGAAASLPLRAVRLDPGELLAQADKRFRSANPARQLALDAAPALPAVDGDPARLRRVVDNLLDNARKYSDPGQPIAVATRARDGLVEVEVRDRGIGMTPEDVARVFTPFFRSDRSRARDSGGVGLGLALARRIVEAHGGKIAAESAPGAGTAVRFTLPAAGG